ncbi:BCCT family transporter [Paenibacillus sp. PvP091]|uniref:BCCT family transporter n=1 Tax=Paenibacillus sp. PvP091 TaxID=2806590 RepID=UPI001FD76F29|nr:MULTISPECIES: BCCT family transporter [unclassified Paenibacillus]
MLVTFGFLIFILYLGFSKYGKIRLGEKKKRKCAKHSKTSLNIKNVRFGLRRKNVCPPQRSLEDKRLVVL